MNGIDERRIAFLDNVIEIVGRLVSSQTTQRFDVASTARSLQTFHVRFEFSKFVYDRLVRQIVDVFRIVERTIGRAALVDLFLVLRLDREHTFQYAQAAKVRYGQLELFDRLISRYERRGRATFILKQNQQKLNYLILLKNLMYISK